MLSSRKIAVVPATSLGDIDGLPSGYQEVPQFRREMTGNDDPAC
jgi:hypothetical protein